MAIEITDTGPATAVHVTDDGETTAVVVNVPGIKGPKGDKGDKGNPGDSNVLTIGAVATGAAGSDASATISGATPNQILNLTIPRGNTGATGPANVLTVGTIVTGPPGSNAVVTITGTSPNQVLNVTTPRGDVGPVGPPNVLSIGTVSNGTPGATGSATITGTTPAQTLNLTLPVTAHSGTSATSFAIGTGSKAFTTQAGVAFVVGDFVRIASRANGANYMAGSVTAYSGTTLTVNVTETGGSGTFTDWNINTSGVKGNTGNTGPANSLSVGTVTTGAAGSSASATITGTAPAQVLNLTIPKGDKGDTGSAALMTMGAVTTGAPGSSASATITGTAPNYVLNLTIPRGDTGTTTTHTHTSADITDATDLSTANTIAKRDANGAIDFTRVDANDVAAANAPTANDHLTRKDYVDSQDVNEWPAGIVFKNEDYTMVPADAGKVLCLDLVTPGKTYTLPANVPEGWTVTVMQTWDAKITVSATGSAGADGIRIPGQSNTPMTATTTGPNTAIRFVKDWGTRWIALPFGDALPIGTSASTANTVVRRDANANTTANQFYATGPQDATATALTRKDYVDRLATTDGTVSHSSNAANTLVRRDVSANSMFNNVLLNNTPTATNHATRKDYVDSIGQATTGNNTIVRRDGAGASQFNVVTVVNPPTNIDHATRKDYVDAIGSRVTTLEGYNKVLVLASGAAVPFGTPANTVIVRTA